MRVVDAAHLCTKNTPPVKLNIGIRKQTTCGLQQGENVMKTVIDEAPSRHGHRVSRCFKPARALHMA